MVKLAIFATVAFIGLSLIMPSVQKAKNRAFSIINPAHKEADILSEIKDRINDAQNLIQSGEFSKLPSEEKIRSLSSFLNQASQLVSEAEAENEKTDLAAALSNLISKKNPEPTWLPGDICATPLP